MKKLLITIAVCGVFAIAAPALAADGTISGTVTRASNSAPIVGLYMTAQNIDTKAYSYVYGTGADGSYSFTLAPGTYDITPYTYTYTDQYTVFLKKTLTVTVGSGETKSGQNFALTRRGRFIGHVYSADGVTPILGASVLATNSTASSGSTTTSDGSFIITPVTGADHALSAVGSFTMYITKAGYFSKSISGVALTADEIDFTQNISLTPASTVSGTIRDANGAAVTAATVTLVKSTGTTYSAITNASGAYTVSVFDLIYYNSSAVADYSLSISKTGYVTKTTTLSITAESSTITSKDYTLVTGKTLSGTVVAKNGNLPLTSAVVSLYKRNKARSDTPDFTFTTGSDGAFSFSSLPVGRYRVRIVRSGYATVVIDSLNIAKNITGRVYKLEAAGTITGLIYTGKSISIESASIVAYSLNNGKFVSYTSASANDTGHYTITGLKAGTYRLKIVSADYVTQLVNVVVKTGKSVTKNIKLAAAGSIEGYLKDKETGLPISYTVVRVVGTSVTASSDANGYYVLDGVAPGVRKVTVISILHNAPTQISVKVSAGKVKAGINFTLTPKQ